MPDFMTILLVLFYFLFPVFIIYLTHKSTFLNKVGAVVLAYIFGLILGNMGIMPRASNGFRAILKDKTNFPGQEVLELFHQGLISQSDIIANQVATVQNTLIIIVILFAIPVYGTGRTCDLSMPWDCLSRQRRGNLAGSF